MGLTCRFQNGASESMSAVTTRILTKPILSVILCEDNQPNENEMSAAFSTQKEIKNKNKILVAKPE
jgi:hypothetical protein